jgi:hypothetical protein
VCGYNAFLVVDKTAVIYMFSLPRNRIHISTEMPSEIFCNDKPHIFSVCDQSLRSILENDTKLFLLFLINPFVMRT